MDKQLLRRIPKVDDLLRRPALEALAAEAPAPEPTAEDRLAALEAAMLEMIMGGAV